MKFECPSCALKYKIGDEKLAGRRLIRMRCRQCAEVIEIVSTKDSGGHEVRIKPKSEMGGSSNAPASSSERPTAPPPLPVGSPQSEAAARVAASLRALDSRNLPAAASAAKPPALFSGPPDAAPRVSDLGPNKPKVPRPLAESRGTGSLPARASTRPLHERQEPTLLGPQPSFGSRPARRANASAPANRARAGSLPPLSAGLPLPPLSAAVAPPPISAAMVASAGAHRLPPGHSIPPVTSRGRAWFVATAGGSFGPLTEDGLRELIDDGQVSLDAAVWQEGFANWIPVANIPELAQLLQDPLDLEFTDVSGPPRDSEVEELAVESEVQPRLPRKTPSLSPPSARGATGLLLAAEHEASVARAVSEWPLSSNALEVHPDGGVSARPQRASSDAQQWEPALQTALVEEPAPALPSLSKRPGALQRGDLPAILWLALLVAVGLGAALAYVLLPQQQHDAESIPGAVVEEPAPALPESQSVDTAAATGSEVAAPLVQPLLAEQVAASQPTTPEGSATIKPRRPADVSDRSAEPPKSSAVGASATETGSGNPEPVAAAAATPVNVATESNAAPAAQLDAASISRVVRDNASGVRSNCWTGALAAGTSTKVMVTAKIDSTGRVNAVSASGDESSPPGLESCVANQVKSWTFPAGEGTTTANIPFVFAAR